MHIFISAGEPSGDLHASNLIQDLRRAAGELTFSGFAGPKMQAAGCRTLYDLTCMPIMFFADAIRNISLFRRLKRNAAEFLDRNPVDAVVLVDYPGFNWHIARMAKARGIPVFYYGSPQVWAWASWRVKKLKRLVDHVLCKLPFEPDWFAARGVASRFVGHPFYDEVARQQVDRDFVSRMQGRPEDPLLLVLPGSRNREVDRHWPIFRDAALGIQSLHPHTRVAVGCFSEAQREQVQADVDARGLAMDVFAGRTPELIRAATCALACSGSVSLELLAARLPTVIAYQLTRWQYFLANRFLRSRYITLVNLMAADGIERGGRAIHDPDAPGAEPCPMPEYLFAVGSRPAIAARINHWIARPMELERQRQWLDRLANQYAIPGASERAAAMILEQLGAAPRRLAAA